MSKCYIIGAGDFAPFEDIREGDLIIAADGGMDHLKKCGITPHLFVGDMDSLTSSLPEGLPRITFPERKDYTDMHLSFLEGVARGYTEFEILGGTGGRSDHTFANISLLLAMANEGCHGRMIAGGEVYTVIKNESLTVRGEAGKYISVFALGGEARGVTIKGLDYEVEDVTLTPDFPLGVSNKFIGKTAEISVKDGALLVIYQS